MQNRFIKPATLILLATALALGSSFTTASTAYAETMVVDTETANVRVGPNASAPIIGTATKGLRLELISEQDGWSQVELPTDVGSKTAWIKSSLLKKIDGTRFFPDSVVETSPAQTQYVTDYGTLTEISSGGTSQFMFNEVEDVDLSSYNLDAQHGNNFLFLELGGQACPALYFWVIASEKGLLKTKKFGNCGDHYELAVVDGKITMNFGNNVGNGGEQCVLNESTVDCSNTGLDNSSARNPLNQAEWLGLTATEYLNAEELESMLVSGLGREALASARFNSTWNIESFSADGDWIYSTAMRDAYYEDRVMIGLHTKTKQTFIALKVYSPSTQGMLPWTEYWLPDDGSMNPVISNSMRQFLVEN